MMRDCDMIGIDVVGPGVWARESDADFEEAMLKNHSAGVKPSLPPPSKPALRWLVSLLATFRNHQPVSLGLLLSTHILFFFSQQNPPASSHRWRTLQLYLREQHHLLELERKAKRSIDLENKHTEELIWNNADSFAQSPSICPSLLSPRSHVPFLQNTPQGQLNHRISNATLLSNGMVLKTFDVTKDDKEAAKYQANDNKIGLSSSSPRIYSMPSSAALKSIVQSPRSEPMNFKSLNLPPESLNSGLTLLQSSSTNHQSLAPSSRPPSPHWFSVVLPPTRFFAGILGSMIDMHVGLGSLSQGRHHHPTGSFPSPLIGKPLRVHSKAFAPIFISQSFGLPSGSSS
ncbi:hypothetical protein VP01_119g14 [Puccinia sorghi]|uniref:Uncharacterized protein n=1 Tax=Puccinia sorghi TaxID=27349 RepID=A0A0L6VQM6_9BASI|nr:hypothetical protein VP01_119g14 [Puccinia sorghi]